VTGEERHERCRHGDLTPGWEQELDGFRGFKGPEKPIVVPLCRWSLPEPHPPAVGRAWGGLIDFDRDCAVCKAYDPL